MIRKKLESLPDKPDEIDGTLRSNKFSSFF